MVRLYTFKPYATLDAYEANLWKSSPSWGAPGGGRKNNLIVVIAAVNDRKTGCYYGDQWKRTLDQNFLRIQSDFMNPRFRDQDFAGGFANGIRELARVVNLQVHPPAVPIVPVAPIFVQPSQPVDLTGLWAVMKYGLGLAAISGLLFLAFVWNRRRERRRALQQKARVAKQAAADRIVNAPVALEVLRAETQAMLATLAPEDGQALKAALDEVIVSTDNAIVAFADLNHTAGDPDRPGLSEDEYATMEGAYSAVLGDLQRADNARTKVSTTTNALRALMANIPTEITSADAAINKAAAVVAAPKTAGFKTEHIEQLFNAAREKLGDARSSVTAKRFTVARDEIAEARKITAEATERTLNIQRRKSQIDTGIGNLVKRIETTKEMILAGKQTFQGIVQDYAESCSKSVAGNGTEAVNRVNWCIDLNAKATIAASMDTQNWDEAENLLKQANAWLDEAQSFMRSIVALEKNLIAAKRAAPTEVSSARTDLKKARDYVRQYDPDVRDSIETEITAAQSDLDRAEAELRNTKPDYFTVTKLAKSANDKADRILESARSEHEAAERLRAQATTALRNAQAEYSRAKEYIEDHSTDVKRTAKDHLEVAYLQLTAAVNAGARNPQGQLKHSDNSMTESDRAYKLAKSNVSDAEEARRPVIIATSSSYGGWGSGSPAPSIWNSVGSRSSGSSGGSSGWGSSGSSSSGGGGSSDWGSSSSGGGGSSDSGGSSDGGGGSSSW